MAEGYRQSAAACRPLSSTPSASLHRPLLTTPLAKQHRPLTPPTAERRRGSSGARQKAPPLKPPILPPTLPALHHLPPSRLWGPQGNPCRWGLRGNPSPRSCSTGWRGKRCHCSVLSRDPTVALQIAALQTPGLQIATRQPLPAAASPSAVQPPCRAHPPSGLSRRRLLLLRHSLPLRGVSPSPHQRAPSWLRLLLRHSLLLRGAISSPHRAVPIRPAPHE